MMRFKKIVPVIIISLILGLGTESSYARHRIENIKRPLDHFFKHGIDYRLDWAGSTDKTLRRVFWPVTVPINMTLEVFQAAIGFVGKHGPHF